MDQHKTGDLLLGSIFKEGLDGDICLIGFPHHIGARRSDIALGQDHGPDCVRRFLPRIAPLVNLELGCEINNLNVSDYGNILIQGQTDVGTLEELIDKLQTKIKLIHSKGKRSIVLGGSHDLSYACFSAMKPDSHIVVINQRPSIQIPYDFNKVSATSALRLWVENTTDFQNYKVTVFGGNANALTKEDSTFIKIHNIQLINLNSIRRINSKYQENIDKPYTQAGQQFEQLLLSIQEKTIHVSFSLEAMDSAYSPGVSRPSVIGGLKSEEAVEIMFQIGKDDRVISIDITDYNPMLEDYRTGTLLAHLIYHYLLGRSKAKQIQ